MLDIQFIRDNAQLVKEKSKQKGYDVDVDALLQRDESRRSLLQEVEKLRAAKNELNSKAAGAKPSDEQIEQGKKIRTEIEKIEAMLTETEKSFYELLKAIPNMPLEDVPVGASEDDNKVIKEWGSKPEFGFEPKNHWQIAEARGWIDKERAAKVAGARFAYIKGDLVKLQMAIIQFTIDTLTDQTKLQQIITQNNLQVSDKPFVPVLPPLMIRTELYDAMDRLEPRDDRYKIEGEELWLQGSAEHVLGSMHANEILPENQLPIRYLGYATSFRKEAGSYGKDMEGLFRLHQFDKLEMESLSTAESGLLEYHFLIAIQEYLMQQLGIPYQVLMKCTADIGKPNASGVDINAWLPGQNKYRETHTADYMTDYQARRLNTRYRYEISGGIGTTIPSSGQQYGEDIKTRTQLAHTNDATAFALSRTPIAIIENFQTQDGKVRVPKVLQPFMGGKETL